MSLMLRNIMGIWQINPIYGAYITLTSRISIGMTTPITDNSYYVKLYMVINRDHYPQTSIKQDIIGMALIMVGGVGVWSF